MTSILLCIVAAVVAFLAGRRSLVTGLGTILGVGYAYGITRANLGQTGTHFLFDAAVGGLFLARLTVRADPDARGIPRELLWWVALLIAWPLLLMAVPKQDPLVQLVGLRGNAFLLPFLLFGAQLSDEEKYELALWFAALNIIAFVFAALEFQIGIEKFFPRNAVTIIMYMSNDVGEQYAYRIPGVFSSAHAYGGAMVATLPMLLGAWLSQRRSALHKTLIAAAVFAASVGVFMSAARSHAVLLFVFLGFATIAARMSLLARTGWFTLLALIALLVAADARLQRFTSLSDTGYLSDRVGGSVNETFVEDALKYPMGNGLGGGGTSMPYFLEKRLHNQVQIENEYARIMLEQGIPGLVLWMVFVGWLLTRLGYEPDSAWKNARVMAWCVTFVSFGSAIIGTGLLTSIPQTAIFLLNAGWLSDGKRRESKEEMSDEWPGDALPARRAS